MRRTCIASGGIGRTADHPPASRFRSRHRRSGLAIRRPVPVAGSMRGVSGHTAQSHRERRSGGTSLITAAVAPVVAIPTTAGTGAEVGRAALLTLDDGRKLGFISPYLIPKRAICDPDLTIGLSPRLTAATGLDALSHCIETYLSPRRSLLPTSRAPISFLSNSIPMTASKGWARQRWNGRP